MAASHVVVIGAGAVGASAALHALAAGLRVTLVEPDEPGGRQAASYGNAGWLSSHSVLPPAAPGLYKQIPKWLSDPLGPLALRWGYVPQALPWLWRYLRAARTWPQVARTAQALRSLLADAPALHQAQARAAGVAELIEQRGLLHVFLNQAQFEREARAWAIRREQGIAWQTLDAPSLREREPGLAPRYTFAVHVPEAGHCRNPGAYVAALVRHAQSQGATLYASRATGFRIEAHRLRAVRTPAGDLDCDRAVIATGIGSRPLAAQAGDNVPLAAERGYHAVIGGAARAPSQSVLTTSAQFADAKMVVTAMDGGLRAAGQVEIAHPDAPPNWARARILHQQLLTIFPALAKSEAASKADFWLGCRPSLPDGLACIGPGRACADIIHAYGHGHVGLVGSARTGRLVAQLLTDTAPEIDLTPFSPRRFA